MIFDAPPPLCTIFTILLTLWNSEQKNGLLIKLFCFYLILMKLGEGCSYYTCILQFHQVSSKSDEKQKSFINSRFFCSKFQSVSRIVKIIHHASGVNKVLEDADLINNSSNVWATSYTYGNFYLLDRGYNKFLKGLVLMAICRM